MASTTSRAVTASARVLVVLSDGGDKASWVTRDEAVQVQASNVVIYTISLVEPVLSRETAAAHTAWRSSRLSGRGRPKGQPRLRLAGEVGSPKAARWGDDAAAPHKRRRLVVAAILGAAPRARARTDFRS